MSAVRVATVRTALAQYLDAQGVAAWLEPPETYPADARAVTLRDLPSEPDAAVAIEVYDVRDDLVLPDVEIRVQLLFRARGEAVDDFADDAFDVLHGRHHFQAGALVIQRCRRISTAPLGPDDNGREQRADNYGLVLMRAGE